MYNALRHYDVERYIQATAKRADLRVIWEKPPCQPRTDGKNIWLPRITDKTSNDDVDKLMAFVAHEVGHNLYSDMSMFNEYNLDPSKSFLAAIAQCNEDLTINYNIADSYIGDQQRLSTAYALMAKDVKNLEAVPKEKLHEDNNQRLLSLLAWQYTVSSQYLSGISHIPSEVAKLLNTKGFGWYEKLMKSDVLKNMEKEFQKPDKGRSRRVYKISKWIYENIYGEDSKKEEERLKEEQQKQGKGKGEGKEKQEGGKNDKGAGKEGEGEKDEYGEAFDRVYEPFNEIQPPVAARALGGEHHLHYKTPPEDKGAYRPTPLEEMVLVDYVNNISRNTYITSVPEDRYGAARQMKDAFNRTSDTFAQRVRMLLQIRAKARTEYGVKKGSIHSANIHRIVLKDARGYNERIFKRKIENDTLDTCVQVLVDISGSMSGSKVINAAVAAAHLSDAIGNALHIPTEIFGFTDHGGKATHFIYRGFNTKQLSDDVLLDRIGHSSEHMENNADGDSILFGYNRIIKRPEKRKLMIVLSDGSPAAPREGNVDGWTKFVVDEVQKSRAVEIVGIGIMDHNVRRFYKQHYVISDSTEIEKALLTVIQKKLF